MFHGRFIIRRSKNIGLSHKHARILGLYFQRQIDHQGLPGAVDFFKKVGDCIVYGLSNSGSKPKWVGTSFRYPRALVWLKDYPEETQLRIAKLARAIRYPELRPEQIKKSVSAVTDPYSGSEQGLERLTALIKRGLTSRLITKSIPVQVGENKYPLVGRQFSKVMSVSGPIQNTMAPPIAESIMLWQGSVMKHLPGSQWMFYPLNVLPYQEGRVIPLPESQRDPSVVGEIHATQEGGGKLRMYAAPYTVFQLALTPLHEALADVRKSLPSDCTYDQESGAIWAQHRLRCGQTVCSVDLSSATDRFPLDPQIAMLEGLGIQQVWIDALMAMCQGVWKVGPELTEGRHSFPQYLQWKVGQPLGIRPSMSMFSLAHNMVLTGLCYELGLDSQHSFRVLGDDVVMVEELYVPYTQAMADAGVPISWHKTHRSKTFAEFAGFSITPSSLVRPGQWRPASSRNFLSLAEWLEAPTKGEVAEWQVELQKFLLFRLDKWSPEVSQWNKFLRANSVLNEISLSLQQPFQARTWISGFTEECHRQIPHRITFFPERTSFMDAFKPCKGLLRYEYWYDIVSDMDWLDADTVMYHGWMLIEEAFRLGEISLEEASERLDNVVSATIRLLWMPPKTRKRSSGAYIRKLANLLAA